MIRLSFNPNPKPTSSGGGDDAGDGSHQVEDDKSTGKTDIDPHRF